MPGRIFNGGTFGPGWVGEPGDIYLDSPQIWSSSTFAEGTTFITPRFFRTRFTPYSYVGAGAVVEGGTLDWVEFHPHGTIKDYNCPQGNCIPPDYVDNAGDANNGNMPFTIPSDTFVITAWGAIPMADACTLLAKCQMNYLKDISGPGWEFAHAGQSESG